MPASGKGTPPWKMDGSTAQHEECAPDLFRPSKRRKVYRKKAGAESDDDENAPALLGHPPPTAALEPMTVDDLISRGGDGFPVAVRPTEELQPSIQDIIRQRKAGYRRRAGIEFSNHTATSPEPANGTELSKTSDVEDEIPEDIKSVISRFAPQTGQVTDETNQHM